MSANRQRIRRRIVLAAGQQNLTGPLKFDFSGYPSAQRAVLQAFVRDNYANMVAVYGAPAPEQAGKTVKVRFETKSADYEPPAATNNTGGTIFFGYDSASNQAVNTYNFTRVALIAFQGPRVPAFDFAKASYVEPWLYGMADAAALQVAYLAGGSRPDFQSIGYKHLRAPDLRLSQSARTGQRLYLSASK